MVLLIGCIASYAFTAWLIAAAGVLCFSETMKALCQYHWPGNIRELQNVIERAVVMTRSSELQVQLSDLTTRAVPLAQVTEARTLEEAERAHILATLKQTGWVVSGPNGAAARLGMYRSPLQFRMKKLGISVVRGTKPS